MLALAPRLYGHGILKKGLPAMLVKEGGVGVVGCWGPTRSRAPIPYP
jgi:hypothetical protein